MKEDRWFPPQFTPSQTCLDTFDALPDFTHESES